MCYDDNARPPFPPGANGQAHGEELILTSADGSRFIAYLARPAQARAGSPQVVIYPDIRGLHQFYKDLALRLAEVGIAALAFDYFGRTAGQTTRTDDFEFMPHVQQLTFPNFLADARAALAHLETGKPKFIMGFCIGGSFSIMSSIEDLGLTGAIGFYAGLNRQFSGSNGTVLAESVHVRNPFLGLFGGADQGIPAEQVHTLDENLDRAGVEHQIVIYEGAPHSFFDRRATDYAEACTDSWTKILAFIDQHSV
ncbi:MAG TPA: dienelactone hydrolase family protein [Ktedonobacteraceae bacterium]|nr:dienelactone hydrolase family protein [Ktedonobacteraceae bacterium]